MLFIGSINSNTAQAQALEKTKVSIAVGGKPHLYYLPLTIAEQLGYFTDEGLQVEISDFAGGAKSLQALIGGSVDVVAGAYEHTIRMQAKNQHIVAFVLLGRTPQIVMAVSKKTMPNYKSIADLKGKKIGITAPGSSTNMMSNFILAKGGLKSSDVSYIGLGSFASAYSALQFGKIDVLVNVDPLMTKLRKNNAITIISDTRTMKDTLDVFGGPMPAGTLYTSAEFLKKYPNTSQALVNAMVRALKWIQKATPSQIADVVPASYLLGDRDVYMASLLNVHESLSPDGLFPKEGPVTALRALQSFDSALKNKKIDLSNTYTNVFADKANVKYK